MDPNANLQEQEGLLNFRANLPRGVLWTSDLTTRLAELRMALLFWLAGGGFEPDWGKAPRARVYFDRKLKLMGLGTNWAATSSKLVETASEPTNEPANSPTDSEPR
jgi:hypothetical protein